MNPGPLPLMTTAHQPEESSGADGPAKPDESASDAAAERDRWAAWRAGIAGLRRRTGRGASPRLLRACAACQAVCFTPARQDARDVGTDDERWVEPPGLVRRQLQARAAWGPFTITHGLCPRCDRTLYAELAD